MAFTQKNENQPKGPPKHWSGHNGSYHDKMTNHSQNKPTTKVLSFETISCVRGCITLKTKVQKLEGEAFIEAIQLIQNNSHVK